ncbi:MAG: hybrid sensor histidine kinase/response regulator [Fimbriimonas sp.]
MKKRGGRPRYPSAARQYFGILLTVVAIVGNEIYAQLYYKDHNPGSIFLFVLLFVTYWSGLRTGVIATAITIAYFFIHFSIPGALFTYRPGIPYGILFATILYLVFILPLGLVQSRLRNAGIREYDSKRTAESEAEGRLKAEGNLRTSEDMWRLVVDSAMDAIIVMGEDGRITLWNRFAESMFGWRADEAVGQVLAETIIPPAHREAHAEGLRRYLETGDGSFFGKRLELTGLAKDGTEFPIELSVVAHWTDAGTIFIGFVRDMTVQSKLNERLRQAQKMEAIGTLAAGIAHDFNNILAAISGNLLLARGDLPADHPAQRSHAEIEKAVARAANVVRQVLTFSSPKATGSESIDLAATMTDCIDLLRTTLPASLEIVTTFEPDLPPILADATDIHQIVLNLGINAHHAMRGLNGRLEIRVDRVYLDETKAESIAAKPGTYARLTVRDNGSGMDAATLKRLFDPFFTTKATGEGTGLGLAVVYGIVERHQGAITVESEVGNGTTFQIYFPVTEAQVVAPVAKTTSVVQGNGERILYVDDDDALVFMVKRMLPRLNYRVEGIDDAREALEVFRADPDRFDLVITDMSMPYLDGPALVRELRAIRSTLPIVMVTGYIRDSDLEQARELGVNALILKPNTVHEMSEDLHRILTELRTTSISP